MAASPADQLHIAALHRSAVAHLYRGAVVLHLKLRVGRLVRRPLVGADLVFPPGEDIGQAAAQDDGGDRHGADRKLARRAQQRILQGGGRQSVSNGRELQLAQSRWKSTQRLESAR